MKSLHLKIDDTLYQSIKTLGFLSSKTMAALVREIIKDGVSKREKAMDKTVLVLSKSDEKRVRKVLAEKDRVSQNEFDEEFGFNPKDFS